MDHVVGEEKARKEARKGVSTVPSTMEEERERPIRFCVGTAEKCKII
jgi:hypothetical protein